MSWQEGGQESKTRKEFSRSHALEGLVQEGFNNVVKYVLKDWRRKTMVSFSSTVLQLQSIALTISEL